MAVLAVLTLLVMALHATIGITPSVSGVVFGLLVFFSVRLGSIMFQLQRIERTLQRIEAERAGRVVSKYAP